MTETVAARAVTRRPRVSPLRYPGGKAALYTRLRKLIRDSDLAGCTYVEPYAGGAGAGLGLLVTGQVSHVVVNDLDPAIHAFWKTVVEDPDFLMAQVRKVELSVPEWRRQRAVYSAADQADLSALGFATFYLNRTNRSGVLNGGPIGGLDQSGNYKIDARFNRAALVERIRILSLYAECITTTCRDGIDVITEYATQPGTFIYADPPYFEKAGSLYMNAFQSEDHDNLARVLNGLHESSWLLTYDNVPRVDELYGQRRRRQFELSYSAHRVMKATEIAVLSDSMSDIEDGWPVDKAKGA